MKDNLEGLEGRKEAILDIMICDFEEEGLTYECHRN
jgi:hypothetical protein